MSSNLKVNTILPSTGTNIGIGTAGGSVTSAGSVGIGTDNPSQKLHVVGTAVEFQNTQSTYFQINTTDTHFYTGSLHPLRLGTNSLERLRIDSSGRVLIDTTSNFGGALAKLQVNGDSIAAAVFNRSNNGTLIGFKRNSGSDVGTITVTASSTSYNTSSDYRLKENVTAISDGITRLKTLKPSRFNFIADATTTVDGFLAHEVTAVPEAITGTKDEVDSDNKPVYQGIDQSKLVPLLVAALQEAIAKIETLETKVAVLEGS